MRDLIQSLLKVVASFQWPVALVSIILSQEECSKILFNVDFLDYSCLSLAISKSLGSETIISMPIGCWAVSPNASLPPRVSYDCVQLFLQGADNKKYPSVQRSRWP